VFQQREIGLDVPSFELAIKSVLRQNPDIILIGEMRDRETFETAISAAETGHLVFSTMHAATVAQSLTRLFEFFPPEQHGAGAPADRRLHPRLHLPEAHPEASRAAAACPPTRSSMPTRRSKPDPRGPLREDPGLLESGVDTASFSFNKDLYRLIKAGRISKADGVRFSPNPQQLEMNLKGIFIKRF
jgi:twitching motility protein PilT